MHYIEHYTEGGDIVLDGFCGTGMTGVAAQLLGRKAILSDLSPIATFIAYNYNNPVDILAFEKEANRILKEVEEECGWMYETEHQGYIPTAHKQISLFSEVQEVEGKGKISCVVWSDVFICPYCTTEYTFWHEAYDSEKGEIFDSYPCPNCKAKVNKSDCEHAKTTYYDDALGKNITKAKQVPVLINYTIRVKQKNKWKTLKINKIPDQNDVNLFEKIENLTIPYWFPTDRMMEGDESRRNDKNGITHIHHFYTKRNLWIMSAFYQRIRESQNPILLFLFTGIVNRSTLMNRIHVKYFTFGGGGWNAGYLKGTLYISSVPIETSIFEQIESRKSSIISAIQASQGLKKAIAVSTNSVTKQLIVDNSIDYIFTDPPFGANIMYSELSSIWESWIKVLTNNQSEAIINKVQNKNIHDYNNLMVESFKEYYRVLKPKRWITVEFNNSSSAIWNGIQDAMVKAGFIIAQVGVLDKKQNSFQQINAKNSVRKDLVISAYKPSQSFEQRFLRQGGHQMEAEFVNQFLDNLLPKPSMERTEKMLYSKMLAFYIQHGYEVRYDAKTFYKMLSDNFAAEDGLWFNANQINSYLEYKKRLQLEGIEDVKTGAAYFLFVSDEKSALAWLYVFLQTPKTFSDVSLAYNQIAQIQGDTVPDLREVLEDNFVVEGGVYRLPKTEQEHTEKTEKRERALMREFEGLLLQATTEKGRIKTVRKEALNHGFEICYKNKRYADILTLSKKLDKTILENDGDFRTMVEAAELMVEGF
jgi:DNA modification methylase